MNKELIRQTITGHEAELKSYGVKELRLFGSFLTENVKDDSDVDLLVTMDNVNYQQLFRLHLFLENLLRRKVDLIRKGPHLNNNFLSTIQSEIIYG